MINLKKIYCSVLNHNFVQIEKDTRVCKVCSTTEKRVQITFNKIDSDHKYSDWRPAKFINSIAVIGDKVRILSEGEASSYWLTMESCIDKVRFMHPSTEEYIVMKQDPTLYTIL